MLARNLISALRHGIAANPMAALAVVQEQVTGLLSTSALEGHEVPDDHVMVFRGDSRSPEEIKAAGGFKHRGSNTDLQAFVEGNTPSIYVSTSPCERSARGFAPTGYVYAMVVPRKKCIDVAQTLGSSTTAVDYDSDGTPVVAAVEAEFAIPHGISWDRVVCATRVAMSVTAGKTEFNADYTGAENKTASSASRARPALAMWSAQSAAAEAATLELSRQ